MMNWFGLNKRRGLFFLTGEYRLKFLVTVIVSISFFPFYGAEAGTEPVQDPHVRRSWDLSFVAEGQRPHLAVELNRMSREIDDAIDAFSRQEVFDKTVLCNASLVCFNGDIFLERVRAERYLNAIYIKRNQAWDQINEIPRTIFYPSHRKNLTERLSADDGTRVTRDAIILELDGPDNGHPPRKNFVAERIGYHPLLHFLQLEGDGYIGKHFDDSEGQAIDQLVKALDEIDMSRVTTVYPLFCTVCEPCLCCLISIQDYLTEKLRERKPDLEIVPIVASKGAFYEKKLRERKPIALLRTYYTLSAGERVMVPAAGGGGVDGGGAPPTILHLCHMGILPELPMLEDDGDVDAYRRCGCWCWE